MMSDIRVAPTYIQTICGKRRKLNPFNKASNDLSDYAAFLQTFSVNIVSKLEQQYRTRPTIMSSNQGSSHFVSQSYTSSSFSSSRNGEAPQTWRSTETTSSNPQGTTIHRTSEQPGQLPTQERLQLDAQGKPMLAQPQGQGRIEDVSEADQEYLERMEDEYAKREGGA